MLVIFICIGPAQVAVDLSENRLYTLFSSSVSQTLTVRVITRCRHKCMLVIFICIGPAQVAVDLSENRQIPMAQLLVSKISSLSLKQSLHRSGIPFPDTWQKKQKASTKW